MDQNPTHPDNHRKVVCIGGPLDGQMRRVNLARQMRCEVFPKLLKASLVGDSPIHETALETAWYELRMFGALGDSTARYEFEYWALSTMTPADVIERLLKSYAENSKKGEHSNE